MKAVPLSREVYLQGISKLVGRDPHLAFVIENWSNPPFWTDTPDFAGLVHIILSQQVSVASADAAFTRLGERIQPIDPEGFLTLDDANLKKIGFSRQKTGYARGLAQSLLQGQIDLDEINQMDDEAVQQKLVELKGIGPWTAEIYLLMALRRPDIWPAGDLALLKAAEELLELEALPSADEFIALGEPWRPWRSVAARILWHYYLRPR